MKKRVVGTAGHIDHGKTALVRAITGIDCDRLPEEKRRGITIDLGFANWSAEGYQIGFIDVPGHERFVKNMLAGIGGIDSALLVVAADESIKPQTREHLAICQLLRIESGVVALTKRDLVDEEILEIVRLEIEELTRDTFLQGKPILPVSSTTGQGLEELKQAILASVVEVADRDTSSRVFRLPIDRVFTMKGFGTVVTGTTVSGSIAVDEEVEILPSSKRSRVRHIQVHGEPRDIAVAGERTSINLSDVSLQEIERGEQLLSPDTLATSGLITAHLQLLADAAPLKDQARVRFHHYASELLGTVRIVSGSGGTIGPGESAFVQIRLEAPVVATAGDRFVIRRYSPATTIGGGEILDPQIPRMSRGTREEIFRSLLSRDLTERVIILTRLAGRHGLSLKELQARTGLRSEALLEAIRPDAQLVAIGAGPERRWLHHEERLRIRKEAMKFLRAYFETNRVSTAVPKGEFLQKTVGSDLDSAVAAFVLEDLAGEKIIRIEGDQVAVPGRSNELTGTEGDLARVLENRFAEAGLKPPPVSELIQTIAQKPKVIEGVLGFLVKRGTLIRLAEGVYLHGDVVEKAKTTMRARRGQTIDVGAFKELFGLSRKIAIPLLELFDRESVTRRVGDQRHIL